tara:strand:- start:136 stop:756 length:621 start_codon:yes stop_codon:yes gene_type:complete
MKKLLSIVFVSVAFMTISNAQNFLFDEGQSGFHVGGQVVSYDGGGLIGIIPGYTSNGIMTISFGLSLEDNNDGFGSSTGIGPSISYLAVKQDDKNPVSVGISSGFQYNTFSDANGLSATFIRLGGFVTHKIAASETINIIPIAGIGWVRAQLNFEGSDVEFIAEEDIGYSIGCVAQFNNKFYITPTLSFSDGNSQFQLLFGMTFPK